MPRSRGLPLLMCRRPAFEQRYCRASCIAFFFFVAFSPLISYVVRSLSGTQTKRKSLKPLVVL